eukprot:1445480-Pyramimonas_sp.AAC.2
MSSVRRARSAAIAAGKRELKRRFSLAVLDKSGLEATSWTPSPRPGNPWVIEQGVGKTRTVTLIH